MKIKLITGVLSLLVILCLSQFSCVSYNEVELYDLTYCDTSDVTWEYPIREILEVNCVPCHNPELHYRNVRHDNYTDELKVVNDGRLRAVVNHLPGYTRMPYQQARLPDCELELINRWLDNGAPEN